MQLDEGRLAIFLSTPAGGGAQRALSKLAGGIAARGHAIDLVFARAQGPLAGEVPDGVRLVDLEAPRVAASVPALVDYLRRERPRAMLSALGYVNVMALLARRLSGVSMRLVVSQRNTLSVEVAHAMRWRSRLMPLLIKRFYPWADGIVAVSQGVAEDLARTADLAPERIRVIYNPIVTPQLLAKAREPLEHPWFGSGEPPVILAAGRLSPQKDFGVLMRAFAELRHRRAARLMILGEGSLRPRLEALARKLGVSEDVALPGFIPNPYPYMTRSALFVLSSRWEGLPGVLIEALACGTRLLSTDCPSGPQEILAGGRFGALVPVGDVGAMARAMDQSLSSPRRPPPPESLAPYLPETVIDQYLDALLGAEATRPEPAYGERISA